MSEKQRVKEMMYYINIKNEVIQNREAINNINKQLNQLIVYKKKPSSIIISGSTY